MKIGDKIRIKPIDQLIAIDWQNQYPHSNEAMAELAGKVLIINSITDKGFVMAHGWNWHPDWYTKNTKSKIQLFKRVTNVR